MPTTKEDLKNWLYREYHQKATKKNIAKMKKEYSHMIVVCDTWDYEDYPVYVKRTENIHDKISEYNGKNMQKIMEVYSYDLDLDEQLETMRCYNV